MKFGVDGRGKIEARSVSFPRDEVRIVDVNELVLDVAFDYQSGAEGTAAVVDAEVAR